jgi:hypothetical protein
MKRDQIIRERRAATSEAEAQAADVRAAVRDALKGSAFEYLTAAEAAEHLRFATRNAFYKWARLHAVPRAQRGRRLLFLRRDLDRLVQGAASPADLIAERHQPVLRHRRVAS